MNREWPTFSLCGGCSGTNKITCAEHFQTKASLPIGLLASHGAQAVIVFNYSTHLYYSTTITVFSKYSSQTFQIQFLEEASTGQCVGANPEGPHTLHRD